MDTELLSHWQCKIASSRIKRWVFLFCFFYKKVVTQGVETPGEGSLGRSLLCTCGGAQAALPPVGGAGEGQLPWKCEPEDSWPVLLL